MLIWYGNIPEETEWYLRRQTGPWGYVSVLLLIGHFFLPFFVLISRGAKRHKGMLGAACVWILAMHWFDVYWLIMPEWRHPQRAAEPGWTWRRSWASGDCARRRRCCGWGAGR